MFRFSKFSENPKYFEKWQKWFDSIGIKTEIKKDNRGGNLFALWRNGQESIEDIDKEEKG